MKFDAIRYIFCNHQCYQLNFFPSPKNRRSHPNLRETKNLKQEKLLTKKKLFSFISNIKFQLFKKKKKLHKNYTINKITSSLVS